MPVWFLIGFRQLYGTKRIGSIQSLSVRKWSKGLEELGPRGLVHRWRLPSTVEVARRRVLKLGSVVAPM